LWLKSSLLLALVFVTAAGMSAADISRARDFGYRQQYDSALAITAAAIGRDPSDPAGYYWQAAILQLLINDSGRGALADSFYALSDRAVALCRQRLGKEPEDSQAHLYYGMTQLNRSSFLGWQQRKLAAFKAMTEVAPHLNAALKRDSSLTDARLGLAMIEYFGAMSSRYTLGLQLTGSRKKAYAVIRPLADGNGPLKAAAELMMAYMLREDGDCDAATVYCRRLLASYPGNRSTLRLMRDGFFKANRYAEAVQVGAEIDSALPKAFRDNKYGMAENWIVCGKAYAQMGQKEEARKRFDRVIAWEPHQADVPWLPRFVREAKQWRKRL
jgi:tetratricopeptide (TPR) repeat protein